MRVCLLVPRGRIGGRVVGSGGWGAGGNPGLHGVGLLKGKEIDVGGAHGHAVGLEGKEQEQVTSHMSMLREVSQL